MNWDNKFASDVKAVPFSGIRKFFDLASSMKDVISLGVGEPDYAAPFLHSSGSFLRGILLLPQAASNAERSACHP